MVHDILGLSRAWKPFCPRMSGLPKFWVLLFMVIYILEFALKMHSELITAYTDLVLHGFLQQVYG